MPMMDVEREEEVVDSNHNLDDSNVQADPAPILPTSTSKEPIPLALIRRRSSSISKPPTKPQQRQKKTKKPPPNPHHLLSAASSSSSIPPHLMTKPLHLLICSIGNPGAQHANTLHSAGHTVLNRLAIHLGYPTFTKDRSLGNGLASKHGDWTLWQSTSYMNESGKGVRAAWNTWNRSLGNGEEGRLVIVHDELEKPLGAVSLRTGKGLSAKGHNGIKSVLSAMGGEGFARIGIGIGRPVSRSSEDVARYVLQKMNAVEREKVEGCVEGVVEKLREVEIGRGREG